MITSRETRKEHLKRELKQQWKIKTCGKQVERQVQPWRHRCFKAIIPRKSICGNSRESSLLFEARTGLLGAMAYKAKYWIIHMVCGEEDERVEHLIPCCKGIHPAAAAGGGSTICKEGTWRLLSGSWLIGSISRGKGECFYILTLRHRLLPDPKGSDVSIHLLEPISDRSSVRYT